MIAETPKGKQELQSILPQVNIGATLSQWLYSNVYIVGDVTGRCGERRGGREGSGYCKTCHHMDTIAYPTINNVLMLDLQTLPLLCWP